MNNNDIIQIKLSKSQLRDLLNNKVDKITVTKRINNKCRCYVEILAE